MQAWQKSESQIDLRSAPAGTAPKGRDKTVVAAIGPGPPFQGSWLAPRPLAQAVGLGFDGSALRAFLETLSRGNIQVRFFPCKTPLGTPISETAERQSRGPPGRRIAQRCSMG